MIDRTDQQKIDAYDRLVALLKDRIEIENHYRDERQPEAVIEFLRADSYGAVVILIAGNVLPGLPAY